MGFFDGIKKLTQPFEEDDDFYDDDEASTPLPVDSQQEAPAPEKKSSFFSSGSEPQSAPQQSFTPARVNASTIACGIWLLHVNDPSDFFSHSQ